MKKVAFTVTVALLALPAVAGAKSGVIWDKYPDTAKIGQKLHFTAMAFPEGPNGGSTRSLEGRHPLITFRSKSGRTLRVRASALDLNGIGYGSVAFPDRGPWTTEVKVGDVVQSASENSEPIRVGAGLFQIIPSADATRPKAAAADPSGFPWLWVLALGVIGSVLVVLVAHRRGHWGAA
jgi:hypothetical protein